MTARVPAFWRVVRTSCGHREYWGKNGWSLSIGRGYVIDKYDDAETCASNFDGRVVPVYVTVRKVPRGHDFAWALRQMRKGARVVRRGWLGRNDRAPWSWSLVEQFGLAMIADDVTSDDWQLSEVSP